MATIQQSIGLVRTMLRDPKAQQPADLAVFKRVLSKYQFLLNVLNNTGNAWATGETVLSVSQNIEDYEINSVGDFGKALLVETSQDGNPSHWVRPVMIYNLGNIDINVWEPRNIAGWLGTWDGSNTTAERMAFFRKGGMNSVWVRVRPVPQLPAIYKIIYEIGDWASSAGLDSELLLPEFHELVLTRAAMSLLPLCDWGDEALNQVRRKELMVSLKNDESEYAPAFDEYKRAISLPRMSTRHVLSF